MRTILLLLLPIALGASPAWAQRHSEPVPAERVAAAAEEADPPAPGGVVEAGEAARVSGGWEEAAESTAAQPTTRGFLYHVLLTAVSALITALIWKLVH